ncbi:MAG: bifunctional biotin--[acetyl-CoA-carboxylase] ligase/biotin operon repressor BirA [Aquisalimonadaceae bacterium]
MGRLNSLLRLLADGRQHSGQTLGESLGVSRAAVWKLVARLRDLGVDIQSGAGAGYHLPRPVILLNAEDIHRGLTGDARGRFDAVDVALTVGSTNQELLAIADTVHRPRALLAETQSAGRGRRGREWYSPFGASLYLSVLWPFEELGHGLSGLSLVAGLAVADAIERTTGIAAGLKWPNDIVYQDRKLAGILVELIGEPQGPCKVVIGIGINCELPPTAGAAIDQPWVDLASLGTSSPDRSALAAAILNRCCEMLPEFADSGFAAFRERWGERDSLKGREVRLLAGSQVHGGTVHGVDDGGALLMDDSHGIVSWVSGEVSVRLST